MPGREVLRVRTGLPGSGKSYSVVCELLEFLEESNGLVVHNLPLNVDALADHFQRRFDASGAGPTAAQVRSRMILIPKDVERSWALQEAGPAEYFNSVGDLSDAWLIIDEAHNFIGRKHEAKYRRLWQEFTGELRHRGACLELISQSLGKIADEVEADAGVWIEVANRETEREPFWLIPNADWWQFSAKLRGKYVAVIRQQEHVHEMRRWVANDKLRLWTQDEYIYSLYHSYDAPKNGGSSGRRAHPYESRTWLQLVGWFLRKHWSRLLWSKTTLFLCVIVAWFSWTVLTRGVVIPPGLGADSSPASSSQSMSATTGQRPEPVPVVASPVPLSLTAVFDDCCYVSGGFVYVGEKLDASTLVSVDAVGGSALLADGRRLLISSVSSGSTQRESVSERVRSSDVQAGTTSADSRPIGSADSRRN